MVATRSSDNDVTVELDVGDLVHLTLEDGRRNLFWKKEYFPHASWAMEKQESCQRPANPDATLINTGISLATAIAPDPTGAPGPFSIAIACPAAGTFTVSGTSELARSVVLEWTTSLASPIRWAPLQSNTVPAGPFSFTTAQATHAGAFFRFRSQ